MQRSNHNCNRIGASSSSSSSSGLQAVIPSVPLFASLPDGLSLASILQSGGSVLNSIDSSQVLTPINCFLMLMAAGVGLPVSEDALCIYAGTMLPGMPTFGSKAKLVLGLFMGVVMSDIWAFSLGKWLRRGSSGILKMVRDKVIVGAEESDEDCILDVDENGKLLKIDEKCMDRVSKRQIIEDRVAQAGDNIGFVIRFSFGMRMPLMLLAGFSNQISTIKYSLGTIVGAMGSLALQLLTGYNIRNNPKAAAVVVSSILVWFFVSPAVLIHMTSSKNASD